MPELEAGLNECLLISWKETESQDTLEAEEKSEFAWPRSFYARMPVPATKARPVPRFSQILSFRELCE